MFVENKTMLTIKTDSLLDWLLTHSNDLVFAMNKEGLILMANPVFTMVTGYDPKEQKLFIRDICDEQDTEQVRAVLNTAPFNQTSAVITSEIKHKNGYKLLYKWSITYDSENGIFFLIGDEISFCNSWFDAFMSTTSDPVYIFNREGKIILANEAFEKSYGWALKELKGKILPIIPFHLKDEFRFLKEKLVSGEKIRNYKTIHQRKDGSLIHAKISATPVYETNGQFVAAIGVTRNITGRIEAALLLDRTAEELKENEKKFMELSENINDILCIFDFSIHQAVYISASYEKILGHSKESFYKNYRIFLKCIHPDDKKKFIQFALKQSLDSEIEYRVYHKDGSVKWLRSRKAPIVDEKNPHRLLTVTQDISSLKEKELLLNKKDKLGAVGQLAAGIAHEVRNPLTAIKGFTQLWGQETHHKYSEIILSELERIESIMQEFLMLAKPHQETKFAIQNINKIVQETAEFMKPEALLHNVELKTELRKHLPAVKLEEKQIKQVLLNLIKNAIDAMPEGGNLLVRTRCANDEFVCLEVIDEGVGISQDRIPRLGEPFYSNKEKGTGLGLMVSFKIIEHHQGKIFFESEEKKGTKVEIRLPAYK
ncbi:PAS domain S-box protein [Bacillus xiapuensis]|uniref:PAS domain S-box protein n=1 Tax=Bacillus xiapuensis TaxID=2014075 RepID=UPI000C24B418|nr:PAS domain S-box protein [Bacillus xiapuensis]